MGRLYAVGFADVAVSAAQDLINLTATSGMALAVHRIELGQRSLTAWEAKPVKIVRNPATLTAGSGGGAITPRPLNNGDAAATFTARANDTTNQTTSGTPAILMARDWEFLNGFLVVYTPAERPVIAPSQGLGIQLTAAPSGSMSVSGTVIVEELY